MNIIEARDQILKLMKKFDLGKLQPDQAYDMAAKTGPCKELETWIAEDLHYATTYASQILRKRSPIIEKALLREENSEIVNYAASVIRDRWPEAEKKLLKWKKHLDRYARYVIRGPWPEAEPFIAEDPQSATSYAEFVLKGRWKPAEETLLKEYSQFCLFYSFRVLKSRWPELELKHYRHLGWQYLDHWKITAGELANTPQKAALLRYSYETD